MASFIDLLKLIVDADTKGAVSEFRKLETTAGSSLQGVERQTAASLQGVEQQASGFGGKLKGGFAALSSSMLSSLGPAAIAGGIGAGIGIAVNAASNLNEQISKTQAVFGSSAGEILKWSDTAATSLGQSKTQALEAASSFGNMFLQLGLSSTAAVEMSKSMTGLATDFASFFNTDPATALEAISAAFRGEFDSVQKFVPTINAAAVEQEALKEGLAATTKELTQQDKATATYNLLLQGAGKATGDFARTSDSLANQQRILKAQLSDTAAEIGNSLIPALVKIAQAANEAIGWLEKVGKGVQDLDAASGKGEGGLLGKLTGNKGFDSKSWKEFFGFGDKAKETAAAVQSVVAPFDAIRSTAAAMGSALGPAGTSIGDFARASQDASSAAMNFGGSADAIAENLGHETAALNAANDALAAHSNAVLAAADSAFAVSDASRQFATALYEANAAANDGAKSAGEVQAAYDNETQAAIKVASATVQLAQDQATASGKTLTAKQSNDILISTLQTLAGQASGPTAAALQALIGQLQATGQQHPTPTVTLIDHATAPIANVAGAAKALNGINPVIDVSANTSRARSAINGLISGLNSMSAITGQRFAPIAKGTNNFAGGLALVGELGPELVYLPSGTAVSTAAKTKDIMESGPSPITMKGGGMSGGTVVNIHVSGAVDPYNTARQIQTILAKGNRGGFNTLAA